MRLPRAFYARPTLAVAADLIGKVLVRTARGIRTSGVIVEVEAYVGEDDPACHAAAGLTRRNAPMYGPPGHAYVYLNYGLHALVNVVTEREGMPAAVLIRALEPLDGLETMVRRRARPSKGRPARRQRSWTAHELCRGPGNLTMAMGITLRHDRTDLTGSSLCLEDHGLRPGPVSWGSRIGIRVGLERPWRAYVLGHPAVSGPPLPRRRSP